MIDMTWEQKFAAILALGEASLRMRKPGDWYVSQPCVDIKNGSLIGSCFGNGRTPQAAVEDHWGQLTIVPYPQRIILDAFGANRRYAKWNGFMWEVNAA